MAGPLLKDAQWVRHSFLLRASDLAKVDDQNRFFSAAELKFTDTTPGGNFAINPPPQFTSFADPKAPSKFKGSKGMGMYYSDAIDDNSQIINIRCGTAQFNSMTTFFTGFYDTGAGQLARTGRSKNMFYYLGRAAGFVIGVMSWKLLAFQLIGVGLRFAMEKPSSKFYYLKPTMPLYWNAVTTMVNQLAVNRGIVPRIGGEDQQAINGQYQFDDAALKNLHSLLPDIFEEKGGINVYAMANRAQRLARKRYKAAEEAMNNAGNMNLSQRMDDLSTVIQGIENEQLTDSRTNYEDYLQRWFDSELSKPADNDGSTTDTLPNVEESQGWLSQLSESLRAEMDDGSMFASFRVNSTGSISESFSNSVAESELSTKINGMSSSARSTSFSFAGGNLIGGALGAAIGGVVGAVKDVASGVMDQMQINGLAALAGAAFVDIPKHWQSSTASLPRSTYTIDLVSPYGNPISQMLNLDVPLAMLLAMALPLSTGKQSYTSPFLIELYDRGRCQTRLGMIDSLSVTRGTGNMGFNNDGHAMALQVSFSVVDMSSVLHMPIAEGISLGKVAMAAAAPVVGTAAAIGGAGLGTAVGGVAAGGVVGTAAAAAGVGAALGVFDDDTVFSDYMAVLAGMGLADQIYSIRKLKLNLTRQMAGFRSWTSAAHFAGFVGDTFPGRLVSSIYRGTAR